VKSTLVEARALRDGIDPKIALAKAGIDVNVPASASAASATGAAASAPSSTSPQLQAIAGEVKDTLAKMESTAGTLKPATTSAARIRGVVNLDLALRSQVKGDDIVFIFAKGGQPGAPPMPLAVARHRVSDLPIQFELSDNNAMSPEAKISHAKSVVVTARISRSGDAIARAGDLTGDSQTVTVGTEGIKLIINKQL
jgi:cytochrome c-type biogenesis protein CcmH